MALKTKSSVIFRHTVGLMLGIVKALTTLESPVTIDSNVSCRVVPARGVGATCAFDCLCDFSSSTACWMLR